MGGPRRVNQPMSSLRAPSSTVTLAANMRGGMWTQIVYEVRSSAPSRASLPLPARVPLSEALDHARGTLEHDRCDRRGHARARW